MILGYLLFLPYWIEYKIRCGRDWIRTRVKG
jgi:hypothetical protein